MQPEHRQLPGVRPRPLPHREGHGLVLGLLHDRLRQRAEITASPLRATLGELQGLPPALVIVDDNDVLRDEGEAYARKLTQRAYPPRAFASTEPCTTS